MKWSIFELQKHRNEQLILDETINMDELKEIDNSIRDISPIKIVGNVDIGTNKFTFHFKIVGHFILPCSRTLLDVLYPINIETTEIFYNIPLEERDESDEEINYIEGNTIDLHPIIKQLLIVEIPMQVYSENVDDENAAPQAGDGWQVIEEKEKVEKLDPRLAKLAKLLEKDNEDK